MKLSISYLSMEKRTDEEMNKLNQTNADYIHVDIMDGRFVKNQTEDDDQQIAWLKEAQKPLDIHFMVKNVNKYIDLYECLKPEYITFHVELDKQINIPKICERLHQAGIKVGLAIKPNTALGKLNPYLNMVDLVLVMSVEPGKGGQTFLPQSIARIKRLKMLASTHHFVVEVDGGIHNITSLQCKQAGADMIVVGSYITNHDDYQHQIDSLTL